MVDMARFTAAPAPRCFYCGEESEPFACGEAACWMRPGPADYPAGYFCPAHRAEGDVPIPPDYVVRRVSIVLEVVFAGTSWSDGHARAEAVCRLEEAVQGAGGLISLSQVSTALGRRAAPVAAGEERRGGWGS
jgi:hypothetical protein